MHTFNVAAGDCSYMFWLLQSHHHQTVYHKRKKEIIVHVFSGWDLSLMKVITNIVIYVCYFVEKSFQI
jgi:hypothetical protein